MLAIVARPVSQWDCREGSSAADEYYCTLHASPSYNSKGTKVRVVYDGSAKLSDTNLSLDDCLQTGPNLIPKLFDILIYFRSKHVALTGGIDYQESTSHSWYS